MIRLNVFIQVGAEKRQEVVALSKELVAASLKDNGCVANVLFERVTRPEVPMICETWRDAASLSAHDLATLFTSRVPKIPELASLNLEKFNF